MSTLIIAEKPSLARDIAAVLPEPVIERTNDMIRTANYTVTWLFGHVLSLKEPEDYDKKYAQRSDLSLLPIYFPDWGMKVPKDDKDGTKRDRLEMIGTLLKEADTVIHAGDIDDEGQLLVDEVLRWHNYKGKVLRLSTANTAKAALRKAMNHLEDNSAYEKLGWAAYGRSVADFMVGVNLSRYFSEKNGCSLPIGRVKMPTLGLVILRDHVRENFKQIDYYVITANAAIAGRSIPVKYQREKEEGEDSSRILTEKEVSEIIDAAKSLPSREGIVEKNIVNEKPPLPFNLVELQSLAAKKFGYSPKMTLEITQNLRTRYNAITYNRSNCRYLSSEQFAEAPDTVKTTLENLDQMAYWKDADFSEAHKSGAFNDKLITEHTAIIPSGERVDLSKMSTEERNIYIAIANRYIIQFLPLCRIEKTTLTINVDDQGAFTASTSKIIDYGYRLFVSAGAPDPTELDAIGAGRYSTVLSDYESELKHTSPPPAYTKATLNKDMTRIAKYVEDPRIRKLLIEKDKGIKSENGSIGTSATRSTIIDELEAAGYIKEAEDKSLQSTKLGRELYRILPDEFKRADLTARWWTMQEDIKAGAISPKDLTESVLEAITIALSRTYPLIDKELIAELNDSPAVGKCPVCGGTVRAYTNREAARYACDNAECGMVLWEHPKGDVFKNVKFTQKEAQALLVGEKVRKDLYSAKKDTFFSGYVSLSVESDSKYRVKLNIELAEREVLGICPECGGEVVEGTRGYGCRNYSGNNEGCRFIIWKKGRGLLEKTVITPQMVKELLSGKPVQVKTLYSSKTEKTFSGNLVLKDTAEYGWSVRVELPEQGKAVGKCPRCGSSVIATPYSFRCESHKTGCKFILWKKAQKGPFQKHEWTDKEAQTLIEGKPVPVRDLYSEKKKKTFSAIVVMDDSELSDYGPKLDISFPSAK